MDELLPWFRALPADQRSWVMLVAQAGINSFVEWLSTPNDRPSLADDVFGAAPRELARAVTLQQTVELVRVTIEVVESEVDSLAAPGEEQLLKEAVLRYSREVAFAAAQVYAEVAETRGAWDARLEAMVVDTLLRDDIDEVLPGRAAALGWASMSPVTVAVGNPPPGETHDVLKSLHHTARHAKLEILAGVHGDQLIVVLGNAPDPMTSLAPLLAQFGEKAVVVGPTVTHLSQAGQSARAALAGLKAAAGWANAPRPVLAHNLLPERALCGDPEARRKLIDEVYQPLRNSGPVLLQTLRTYFDTGGALEGTARQLFVHPNTVRYRLRRAYEICGQTPNEPRGAFTVQVALVLGQITE